MITKEKKNKIYASQPIQTKTHTHTHVSTPSHTLSFLSDIPMFIFKKMKRNHILLFILITNVFDCVFLVGMHVT